MAQITSHEELRKWLNGKPADWAQVITARVALRVLPYAFTTGASNKWVASHSLKLMRALIISWAARNFPAHDMVAAANAASNSLMDAIKADDYAAFSTLYAIEATANIDYPGAAEKAVGNAIIAVREAETKAGSYEFAADAVVWANITHDCNWLDGETRGGSRSRRLSATELWPADRPTDWDNAWAFAAGRLAGLNQGYSVWTEWYNRRIHGRREAFKIPGYQYRIENNAILAKLADANGVDFWNNGAAYVNATLQSWIDKARARLKPQALRSPNKTSFFISYSTKEEAMAREVDTALSELGYTSIAQFKDFPQGNFVRGMQEGIAGTDRFIALQSKAYWESDHCQSEWAAAYARDPSAKQRKIIPFLLEPVPLPPIASETVYKALFGLTKAQRKKAIIEWVEYQQPLRSPKQLRKTLAKQASPEVRLLDDKIDAGPNTLFDKPLVDMDLAELPSNLRALLKVLIGSLPDNTPLIVRNCLNGYNEHLLERGAQPIVGTVDPFAEAVRAQIVADAGYWDAGLESLFADFLKRHELLITHFPLNPERELLVAETPIDEVKASGDVLLEPVEAVAKAMAELKLADLTTEDFDRVEEAHKAFSRDIASLPMPEPTDNVTPKRRYVLGTIGFYERLLTALGAAAGIAATPQGQAAIAAVSAAIETFMGFIL